MNTDNQTPAPHQAQPDAFSDPQTPHSTPPDSAHKPSEIPTPDETSLSTWRHNGKDFHPYNSDKPLAFPEEALLWSDDPRIWRPLSS